MASGYSGSEIELKREVKGCFYSKDDDVIIVKKCPEYILRS